MARLLLKSVSFGRQDGRHGHYLEVRFPDCNSKTLLPIYLKLNRVVGHRLDQVAIKVGAIWKKIRWLPWRLS